MMIGLVWLAVQLLLVSGQSVPPRGNVSLSVLGNQQELVGDYCPGTVDLNCTGVGLTVLRWSYNENIDVYQFLTDANTGVTNLVPPFLSVELINVTTTRASHVADFSSVLTADLSQLEQLNVINISCGDSSVFKTLLVNITITGKSVPEDPQIIEVNITQNVSSILLSVYWEQQEEVCPVYKDSIHYTVMLLWNDSYSNMTVNGSSCTSQCSVTFSIELLSMERDENYTVYLQAVNNVGKSNTVIFSGTIAALIECPAPQAPLNGSIIESYLPAYPLGTVITYHCELYPNDVWTAMCSNVSGRGEWIPDPSDLDCSEDNCLPVPELEHGFVTIANTSTSVFVHYKCDDGYTLSGPSIITCTETEGWSADPGIIQCTAAVSSLVTHVAVGLGGVCVTLTALAILLIVIKCGRLCCKKKEMPCSSPHETEENTLGPMYSTPDHPLQGDMQAQSREPNLAAGNAAFYEEIELPSSKESASKHALPTQWPTVNYVTIDSKAGSNEGRGAPTVGQQEPKGVVVKDMAEGACVCTEPQIERFPDGMKLKPNQLYRESSKKQRQSVVRAGMELKANESYGTIK